MSLVSGCKHEWRDIQIHSKTFGDFLASSWNGKVDLLRDESEDLYDIVLENPDYSNRRKKPWRFCCSPVIMFCCVNNFNMECEKN